MHRARPAITGLVVLSAWWMTSCAAEDFPGGSQAAGRPTMRQMQPGSILPPPPSSRDLVAGRTALRRRFRQELSHAETAAGARLAAETLLAAAATETAPAMKWVLLEEARELGEAAGEADIVGRAIALAAADYEFDSIDVELRSLKQIPLRGIDARRAAALAASADEIADRAEADKRPDKAAAAALLASRAWQRAGNMPAAAQSAARHDAIVQPK